MVSLMLYRMVDLLGIPATSEMMSMLAMLWVSALTLYMVSLYIARQRGRVVKAGDCYVADLSRVREFESHRCRFTCEHSSAEEHCPSKAKVAGSSPHRKNT